jgi:hypothetical protein
MHALALARCYCNCCGTHTHTHTLSLSLSRARALTVTFRLPASEDPEIFQTQQTLFEAWSIVGAVSFGPAPRSTTHSTPAQHDSPAVCLCICLRTWPICNTYLQVTHSWMTPLTASRGQRHCGLICWLHTQRTARVTPTMRSRRCWMSWATPTHASYHPGEVIGQEHDGSGMLGTCAHARLHLYSHTL